MIGLTMYQDLLKEAKVTILEFAAAAGIQDTCDKLVLLSVD